jgi:hypothetical protein
LNSTCYDPAVKTGITAGSLYNLAVKIGWNETPFPLAATPTIAAAALQHVSRGGSKFSKDEHHTSLL